VNIVPDFNPNDFSPSYGGQIDSQGNVKNMADAITSDGKIRVDLSDSVELTVSDVNIGAVELKDATTENRMKVNEDGSINMRIVGSIDGGVW
jgi:hypothetical protein